VGGIAFEKPLAGIIVQALHVLSLLPLLPVQLPFPLLPDIKALPVVAVLIGTNLRK
jgi:hypothetical protein